MWTQMQLTALGACDRLSEARCFGCLPLALGVVLGCCLLCLRSALTFLPLLAAWPAGTSDACVTGGTRFGDAALVALVGGDALALLLATLAAACVQPMAAVACACWLCARLTIEAAVATAATAQDCLGLGGTTTVALALLLAAFDLYVALLGAEFVLKVTLQKIAAPSAVEILATAQRSALGPYRRGAAVDKFHILLALLQEPSSRRLLAVAGADLLRLDRDLAMAGYIYRLPDEGRGAAFVDFDASGALAIAAAGDARRKLGDARLSSEHLVLALCSAGPLEILLHGEGQRGASGLSRSAAEALLFEEKRTALAAKAAASEGLSGQGGVEDAKLFGCLPLESAIIAWAVFRVGVCSVAIFILCLGIDGQRSLVGLSLGLRSTRETLCIEGASYVVGAVLASLLVSGVSGHVAARDDARELVAQTCAAGAPAPPSLPVFLRAMRASRMPGVAEDAVQLLLRLQRSVGVAMWYFYWSLLELVLDVPVFGMIFVRENFCGSYVRGLNHIAHGAAGLTEPLHCKRNELILLAGLASWIILKGYFVWAVFLLWQWYAAPGTQENTKAAQDTGLLSESAARLLAGLAGSEASRAETRPLLPK
eukprot:TRINITY_DN8971_c0_g1_i2.p1 TRINITY_DN8971_c0_g1~~TRINITY_DN8971_c0_g1_i2.p1  ORF type:complete len:624 (+),score=149.84 TRINITY_DN8971_c0_g1_i2:82-1872(+)